MQRGRSGSQSSDLVTQRDQITQTNNTSVSTISSTISKNTGITATKSLIGSEYCRIVHNPEWNNTVTIANEIVSKISTDQPSYSNSKSNKRTLNLENKTDFKSQSCEVYFKDALDPSAENSSESYQVRDSETQKTPTASVNSQIDTLTSHSTMDTEKSKDCASNYLLDDGTKCSELEINNEDVFSEPNSLNLTPTGGSSIDRHPNKILKLKRSNESKNEEQTDVVEVSRPIETSKINKVENQEDAVSIILNNEINLDSYSKKTYIDAHNATISTIKAAAEDIIGKAYESSQNAVTLITDEGSKAIEMFKRSKKSSGNESSDKTETHDTNENEVVGRVVTAVSSALVVLGEHITKSLDHFSSKKIPTDQSNSDSKNHIFTPDHASGSNNVFSAIKSKIISIFSDSKPKVENKPITIVSTIDSSISQVEKNEADGEDDENDQNEHSKDFVH